MPVRSVLCSLCLLSAAAPVRAQAPPAAEEAPPPAQASPAKPIDVVKLKDGSLIRGTISEFVPNDVVVIVTLTGETRRIPMAYVAYAGPDQPTAAPVPPPAPPVAAPPPSWPGPLIARLESVDEPITFYVSPDTPSGNSFTKLCTAPCDTALPPGNYRFALSDPGSESPLPALPVVRLTRPATVRGKFRSRSGLRGAGVGILVLGGIVGVVLYVTASSEEEECNVEGICKKVDVTNEAQLWAGGLITVGSLIAGGILLTRGDSASVELVPGAPIGLRDPARFAGARDHGPVPASALSGLSLVGRF